MKRTVLIATLAAASIVAACGGQTHSVTRSQYAPHGIGSYAPDYGGGTSTRSSFDLLSLG